MLVIGISFGGMVAQEIVVRYPHRVERLVLGCTSSGGAGGASYSLHELTGLSLEEWARRVVELSDKRRDANWQAAHSQEFQTLVNETLIGLKVGANGPVVLLARVVKLKRGHVNDTYARLPTLPMPVYICGGRYDGIAPSGQSDRDAAANPQCETRIV